MSTRPEITAALAALPGAGSARLAKLLTDRAVDEAWAMVQAGRVAADIAPSSVRAEWKSVATAADLPALTTRLARLGVCVTSWHDPDHPPQFSGDVDPAPVCFRRGTLPDREVPHVAIVGTRRASTIGREIARELGAGLAAAGVVVVSGLALGVDGSAHHGALLAGTAPPLAVVGSGVDIVYPATHRQLWDDVARVGGLLSEAPMGARPDAWRFPVRNRLIAALSDLVVVVESRAAGGSLLTVEQAMRRGIEVMAVPGSLRNGAAVGTNQLLADGCAPVRDVADVLMALGLSKADAAARRAATRQAKPPVSAEAAAVLEAVDDGPTSTDDLVRRLGLDVGEVFARLAELELSGHIVSDGARVSRA